VLAGVVVAGTGSFHTGGCSIGNKDMRKECISKYFKGETSYAAI